MKPIRILYIINNLKAGGGQRYVVDIVNILAAKNFEVQLVSLGAGNFFEGEIHVPLTELGATKQTKNPLLLAGLVKLILDFRPDIIHTHLQYADTIGQLLGRALAVPAIITTIHNTVEWPRGKTSARTLLEDFAVQRADHLFAVSEFIRDFLVRARHVEEHRITVLPCGVELAPFLAQQENRSAVRRELGFTEDDIIIACTAHFRPEKRHDLLIAAFEQLRASSSAPVKLLLIGAGGILEEKIRTTISQSKHRDSMVIVQGAKARVAAFLAASDIYAMHSEWEGASLAVVEAMASGLPMLLPRLSHFSAQVLDGRDGLLFDFHSPQDFVAQAARLAESISLRKRLGLHARATAIREFGMEQHANKLMLFYRKIYSRYVTKKNFVEAG